MSNMLWQTYNSSLNQALSDVSQEALSLLQKEILACWQSGRQILICGNGGSAANALHWANDLVFGLACGSGKPGMRAIALPANQAIMTCLGNDIGYENIFAEQVRVYGQKGDILLVMSGSGNSPNVLSAIEAAKELGMSVHGILGYDGGKALAMVDNAIHVEIDDMQIAEDAQVIIGHYVTRSIRQKLELE